MNLSINITLPDLLIDALNIDEDTMFESYYEDGKIKVRMVSEEDESKNETCNADEESECIGCPFYCDTCGCCTYDE